MTDCSVKLPSSELSSHRADFPWKECSMVRTMAGVLLAPLPSLALFTCLLPPSGTHPSVTFRRTAARQQTPFKQQQLQGRTLIPTKCQKTAGFKRDQNARRNEGRHSQMERYTVSLAQKTQYGSVTSLPNDL